MKIAVCVVVPIPAKINIGSDELILIHRRYICCKSHDEYAIEEALKTKENLAVRQLQSVWVVMQIKKHYAKRLLWN